MLTHQIQQKLAETFTQKTKNKVTSYILLLNQSYLFITPYYPLQSQALWRAVSLVKLVTIIPFFIAFIHVHLDLSLVLIAPFNMILSLLITKTLISLHYTFPKPTLFILSSRGVTSNFYWMQYFIILLFIVLTSSISVFSFLLHSSFGHLLNSPVPWQCVMLI